MHVSLNGISKSGARGVSVHYAGARAAARLCCDLLTNPEGIDATALPHA